ncbi:helix-turn-helix transcriptional regulator [Microbaculum marinum]|uniref:Helix-turn-helix transcriptional regulator n=1 Tax=Microbaculum marinum TaxID=1764581 RepID=A0AAW9S5J8_9HYPH
MAETNLYLTTKELADLLRVKERKVYELAAASEVPFTRVTGKLLFPRHLIEAWLARHTEVSGDLVSLPDPPAVAAGSHDPLLDWALRESRCGIATFFDGSLDGLERFGRREALFCGIHIGEPSAAAEGRQWNVGHVARRFPVMPVALVEWAWRERGLVVANGNPLDIRSVADVKGRRLVPRQAEAGAQHLLRSLLEDEGLSDGELDLTAAARTEHDVAISVLNGRADAGLGIACVAREYRLGFVPLMQERFDLLVWRRSWFEPALHTLIAFCRTQAFRDKAEELGGYDVSGFGTVHYNGP